jgi:uncharacterized protein
MPNAKSNDRTTSVDFIRTAALIGICIVNLPYLGLPIENTFAVPALPADQIATILVQTLFEAKFFLLFSFLFGWGFAIQMQSAARAEASFSARYFRRLAGLALFGCLHAIFVFSGDILLLYAVLGLFLWPLRDATPDRLMRLALWMIPLSLVTLATLGLLVGTGLILPSANALGGGFIEATKARLTDWMPTFGFLVLFQAPLAFGAFLCGLAAAKSGFFAAGSQGRADLARAFPWLLGFGLAGNLVLALAPPDHDILSLLALMGTAVAAPVLAAAWLHLLLIAGDRVRLPEILIRSGQNSLSAYLLQGILAGFVFGAYGLDLFDHLGQAMLLVTAPVIALTAMLLAGLLARPTGRAPFEALLRRLTYGMTA